MTLRPRRGVKVRNSGTLTIGDNVHLEVEPVRGHLDIFPGARVVLERGVTIGGGFAIACHESIYIGADVRLGRFVQMLDSDLHVAGDQAARSKPLPLIVEDGATIGHWCTILPGSKIGAGATVASYSVVSGHVRPGTKVSGNPAGEARPNLGTFHDIEASIFRIFAEVFERAPETVTNQTTRDQVPEWNSLGSLRLLAAIEGSLGLSIEPRRLLPAQNVRELVLAIDDNA